MQQKTDVVVGQVVAVVVGNGSLIYMILLEFVEVLLYDSCFLLALFLYYS